VKLHLVVVKEHGNYHTSCLVHIGI